MKLQVAEHLRVDVAETRRAWLGDPWFTEQLETRFGRLLEHCRYRECTPAGAVDRGVHWYQVGTCGWLGMLPVSDGTELVFEVRDRRRGDLSERVLHRTERSLRRFMQAARRRLEQQA